MNCKLCNEDRKLVKSHIIPKWCYDIDSKSHLRLYSQNEPSKRAPIGIYDPNLVCEDCERIFSVFDQEGYKIFGKSSDCFKKDIAKNYSREDIVQYTVNDFDYDKLMLFFISLVWRCSKSEKKFFQNIDIGLKYKEIARVAILENRVPKECFQTMAFHYNSRYVGILDPVHKRTENVRFWRLHLGDYEAYIQCDKQKTPETFEDLIIQRGLPLKIPNCNVERIYQYKKALKSMQRKR